MSTKLLGNDSAEAPSKYKKSDPAVSRDPSQFGAADLPMTLQEQKSAPGNINRKSEDGQNIQIIHHKTEISTSHATMKIGSNNADLPVDVNEFIRDIPEDLPKHDKSEQARNSRTVISP